MEINISTRFNPIRMIAGQREPVILDVVVRNKTEKIQLVSVLVKVPFSLGFDKVGLMRESRKRVGYVSPGNEKVVPFQIYCKPNIKEGNHPIDIAVSTHSERYDITEREYGNVTELRVISR